ncbi:MAG TPA: diguanylate cyclase [Solirubrobacterales bacterium]|nr:diguanylate cyclase [Solirubrobacterales bacterium]
MAKLSPRNRLLLRCGGGALVLGFLAFVLHAATGFGGSAAETFFGIWDYDSLMLGAAASCLARAAIVRRERLAWGLLGAGLLAWTAGEIYYSAAFAGSESVPIPSLADAGYLAFYPLAYGALIVLLRKRIGSFPATRWLDGLIVGSAVAALAAALALGPIVDASSSDSTAAVATNLAYPIADLTLLTLVVTAASFTGWRPGAGWLTLGGGLIVLGVSDGLYLLQSAQGTYVEGGILDAAWPLGALLLAAAAWIPPGPKQRVVQARGLRIAFVPAAAALIAIGVQSAERITVIPSIAVGLSMLTLLAVVVRMAISFRDTQASLESSVREALTDPLTGLPNRRKLMEDLESGASEPAAAGNLSLLVMFDLDGFKAYNDSYGHPAGDALLTRLGHRLAAFSTPHGCAYRLGGDEFCLLANCTAAAVDGLVAGGTAALSERGEGFVVSASQGSVLLPSEARTPETALQLADRRMYANKSRERSSAGSQSRDVLLTALRERQPDLHAHLVDVAALARPLAEELGVGAEQRDEIFRAAELHDVGKMAIPDAILNKPGPLDPQELEFMRKHTLIGERIIASAPALVPVARIVRSSHERWDGSGYPDRLEGEQIPLGSRVVAVCDAYQAMVSERPYSVAMLPARALDELARGAGTQFDPEVVTAFERVLAARAAGVPSARV